MAISVHFLPFAPAATMVPGDDASIVVIVALSIAFIVVPVSGIWLGRLSARWFLRGDGEPRCGACGYSVRGLTSMECPECGADLRNVGIVRRDPAGLWWTIIAWSVFIGALWLIALGATLGSFHLSTGAQILRDQAWVPTSVCTAYGVVWGAGVLVILRFRQRPLAWKSQPREGGGATAITQSADVAPSPASTPAPGAASRVLTIMFIDVEGYTALAAKETRDGIVIVIRRARDLVRPVIARHRGVLVKTMGDGFLVTFESATDALLCGRQVQEHAAGRAALEGEKALRFRIGVTTGEVALEESDVYGEPVNMASRIQELTKPGEVYFSEATWHAMTRSEVRHEPAGEHEVKGIEGRVKLYRAM